MAARAALAHGRRSFMKPSRIPHTTGSLETLSVIHVVASLHRHYGGPARTVPQLADALAKRKDFDVTLISQGRLGEASVESQNPAVTRCVEETRSSMALRFGLPIRRALSQSIAAARPSLIHSHGIWLPANHWTARAARRHKIPLMLHPRGMLQATALQQKSIKKQIAMAAYQAADLASVAVMFAASASEHESIRALGYRQPIAILPNGIVHEDVQPQRNLRRDGPPTVLFLSRVHPLKGLDNLVRAWAKLSLGEWRLQIAGPDSDGYLANIQALAQRLGVADAIQYLGEVDGARKSVVYREADIFVLPTFSENFGVVVVEALSHGLPVITTRGAPWADLETHRCGWWIDIGVDPLAKALAGAMALSTEKRSEMGERGQQYAQRFQWEPIASQTCAVYRWALGLGEPPPCLDMSK